MTAYHVRPPDHDHPPLSGREDALPGRLQGPAWTIGGAMVRRYGVVRAADMDPDPDLIALATRHAQAGCLACAQAVAPPEPAWDAREAEAEAGWTCHLGHPTTPPVEYHGAEYRFCPTCEDIAQDGAQLGEYHGGGIIVSTPDDPLGVGETFTDEHGNDYYGTARR